MAGRVVVGADDLGRGVARADPVVEAVRRLGRPSGDVAGEFGAAGGGVVPEKAVAARGDDKGDHDMGVLLKQGGRDAFEVHRAMLRLAHAPERLVVMGAELLFEPP